MTLCVSRKGRGKDCRKGNRQWLASGCWTSLCYVTDVLLVVTLFLPTNGQVFSYAELIDTQYDNQVH